MSHLAQVNLARMRAPLDHPLMAEFVALLDRINALADASPGFVWRLQTDAGNATAIRAYDDERVLFNMSVWESIEALAAFTYESAHVGVFRRRREWFEPSADASLALWWLPRGSIPSVAEGRRRLAHLRRRGPTAVAFSFTSTFPAPGEPLPPPVIVDYTAAHRRHWEALNRAWLERYFTVEEVDRQILADPERWVLRDGGCILFACVDEEVVGTCGLRLVDAGTFELIKMAVRDDFQGCGLGTALARAAIARARQAGGRRLVLETNSRLGPALHVYRKVGFTPVPGGPGSTYARADTALELDLAAG